TMPVYMAAQQNQQPHKEQHYTVRVLPTLGGPNSGLVCCPPVRALSSEGTLVAFADKSTPDPYFPNCLFDCFVDHAIQWRQGVVTDLGTLPGGVSSLPIAVNPRGQVTGQAQNGLIDPLTGYPAAHAVVWEHG